MKKVLLTGVGGFVGSHCLKYFMANTDWYVIGIDSFRHKGTYSRLNEVDNLDHNRFKLIKHDLTVPFDNQVENILMSRKINDRGLVTEEKIDYIISMASDSAVERSVSDPGACWRNNTELAYNMLELARRIKPKIYFHVSCYDENTRILTPNGFKTYNQVQEGEKILSLNSESGVLEEKTIKKIIVQDYEGEMYHFKRGRTDLMVTPNHRMFYENDSGIHLNSAENLMEKSYSYKFPRCNWNGKKAKTTFVEGIGHVNTNDLFYLCGIFIGDGFNCKQEKIVENRSGLNRKDFLKECRDNRGRFANKGKIGTIEKIKCTSYRIYIDIPFKDECFMKVCDVLNRLGIKFTTPKNKSGEHIYFSSKNWLKWFDQFGKHAENKHIPKWMLEYDKEHLEKLFEGLIDSDGHNAHTKSYTTCSISLVRDCCELALKLGYFPRYGKKTTNYFYEKENRFIQGEGYYIHFCRTHPNFSKSNLQKKNYRGKVWCLKVEDNKNLIVERNGYIAVSGNTDEIYGDCAEGYAHPEWDTILPSNPYAASKAAQEALAISYWRSYDVPVVITNCMNLIGSWQDKEKFLPKIIWKIATGQEMEIYADLKPDSEPKIGSRFYLHCENHADVFKFLSTKPFAMYNQGAQRPDRYNVVGEVELNNLEMAQAVAKIMGKPLKYKLVPSESARRGYDRRYALEGGKLQSMGWKAPVEFYDGLEKIVKWTMDRPWWIV